MYKVTLVGLTALSLATAAPVVAQDSDEESGGRLVRFLENTLSGDGRTIRVVGLSGALSSRATIQRLEVSDDNGIWFTLEGAVLDWNRLALVRGRFSVNELSAERIVFARPPGTTTNPDEDLPAPEVTPFQVPELPVAIQIGQISVSEIDIGEPVVGVPAQLSLDGNLSLADGALDALLDLQRLDRDGDEIRLETSFDNSSRDLVLDLDVVEGPGGLIGTAMNLPDTPSIALDLAGRGPLEDFIARLSLKTDDELRFGGAVTLSGLSAQAGQDGSVEQVPLAFTADLGGDIRPLLPEQFHEFFGDDTRIQANGQRDPDGAMAVNAMRIKSQALALDGALDISAEGAVQTVVLQGGITPPSGEVVTLPVPGQVTTVELVNLNAGYDISESRDWTLDLQVEGLASSEFTLDSATVSGAGQAGAGAGQDMLDGSVTANLVGLGLSDPALSKAAGDSLALDGRFRLIDAGELILDGMTFTGAGLDATVDATLDGLDSGLRVDTTASLSVADISRFADLAGKPLQGALDARVSGHVVPLSGGFDIKLDGTGQDLAVGIEQVDPLITGQTDLAIDAARDEGGITLRSFTVNGTAITAEAEGVLASEGTRMTFDAEVDDLARVLPDLPGPARLTGDVHGEGEGLVGNVSLTGPRGISLTADGRYEDGASQAHVDGSLDDLGIFLPQLPGAAQILADVQQTGAEDYEGTLRILSEGGSEVTADGVYGPGKTNARIDAQLTDLAAFVPQLPGAASLNGQVEEGDDGYTGTIRAETADGSTVNARGTYSPTSLTADFDAALANLGIFVPQMPGQASVTGNVVQNGSAYDAVLRARTADGSTVDADATYSPTEIQATFDAVLANLGIFVPQMAGQASVTGQVTQNGDAYDGTVSARAADGSVLDATGTYGPGQTQGQLNADLMNLGAFVPQMPGRATVTADVTESDGAYRGEVQARTADGSTVSAQGAYGDAEKSVTFDALLAQVGAFVPQLAGNARLQGQASEGDDGVYTGNVSVDGTAGLTATASGQVDPQGAAQLTYETSLARVERFVPDFPGTLVSRGTASRDGTVWTIDSNSNGPAGVEAAIAGTYDQSAGTADVTARGQALLTAANAFIAPMAVDGPARFDLRLNGQPALNALSGTIDLPGTRIAIPQVYGQIDPLSGRISMNGGSAQIDLQGRWADGGSFTVTGPVQLSAPYNAGLDVAINQLVLTDQALYNTTIGGQVGIDGPLVGNGRITGVVNVGTTELNIAASSGSAAGAPIPPIRHQGEDSGSYQTRERAGLIEEDDGNGGGGGSAGPGYALDITISAPQQIFVRGRGLDAELGGGLSLRGTTSNIVPAGEISLIRGRLDIVGRRLDLDRGLVTLEGSFDPYIDFEASNTSSAGTATIQIYGSLQEPQVEVTSSPERPAEEALGLLIFGDQFTNLSPLKIAQLANSLAVLTGKVGANGGILGSARDGLGAASLDLTTDEDGNAQVGVGAYLSEQIYTDVSVNTEGRTELDLNFDVTDKVTAKGSVDSEGNSSIGLFFTKDF
ncbi:translocation/assembly module TamB domain-containing protein [Marinibacterium sp. SX1]|uniref:translocation/assembly module TamB domain-containing protein n=1 Tax=Marinibacterium sp. SX1 TaxID=3388424 RepID=UPI003D181C65